MDCINYIVYDSSGAIIEPDNELLKEYEKATQEFNKLTEHIKDDRNIKQITTDKTN